MTYFYNELTNLDNLYNAYKECRKGVDWKYSTQRFESNLLFELQSIKNELINGTYLPSAFTEFDVNERGKIRHIRSPHLRDRVLQRVMYDCVLEPVLYKYLIYDNGASIKGKGVEFTRKRLVKHLHSYWMKQGNEGYILVCDFSKFFDSIPHDKLIKMVEEHIQDEKFMEIFTLVVHSFGGQENIGLGIGAQISQICGVFYPTPIDNYIKIVKGCKYYGRHMDDFYIIHQDKEFLKELLKDINEIASELGLTLNKKKTQICKINKGFVYLKQYIFVTKNGKIIQKAYKPNVVREKQKLKKFKKKLDNGDMTIDVIKQQYKSWRGGLEKYDTYCTLKSTDKLFKKLFTHHDTCIQCKNYGRCIVGKKCWNCITWNNISKKGRKYGRKSN